MIHLRSKSLSLVLGSAIFLLAPWVAAAQTPLPAEGTHGMVVTAEANATRAGWQMLEAGGNAIDAAVAAAFALAVTEPYHSGLGGGGFILLRLADGKVLAVDAREVAPAAATRDMYVKEGVPEDASRNGALAVGVPGLVAGLGAVLEDHGTLPLAAVLEPAIDLAEEGFAIGPRHARVLQHWKAMGHAARFPETAAIQLPVSAPDEPFVAEEGWVLRQPDLAKVLRLLAHRGVDGFYRGEIAWTIATHVQRQGGILTVQDLANYRVRERKPIHGQYRGYEIYSFPPPSSGGIALVETLNILEGFETASFDEASRVHHTAEAMKLAFADRAAYLGDTDFVEVPVEALVAKDYAAVLRERINPPGYKRAPWNWFKPEFALNVRGPGLPVQDGGTTHLSVTDSAGNAVAITQTINLLFGSGMTVPRTGIVLNNEMDDFSKAIGVPNAFGLVDTRGANAIAPGKRPLSSMTPTIVLKDGKLFMVTGSPGGPRIITTTLHTILNVIDSGMNVQQAVAAPRFHHQWLPDRILVEPIFDEALLRPLRRRGHAVVVSERTWSSAQSIVIEPTRGVHQGGSDPRSDGLALGYTKPHGVTP